MHRFDKKDTIIETIATVVFPFIMVFGIYVIINGHLSPGGGFSGGAIVAAALILYDASLGEDKEAIIPMKTYGYITSAGLLTYGTLKGYSFMMGAANLETGIPHGIPGNILSSGLIFPLNVCVGIVVGSTMYVLYRLFSKGDI